MGEWRRIKLGEVLTIKHGYAFPGSKFSDDPSFPIVVTPGNFAIGGGFRATKIKSFTGDYPAEYLLSPGDLILTMTDLSKEGATLGLPATVPSSGMFLHNQRIGLVESVDDEQLDTRFLNYYLRTADYRSHILGTASGSTVRHTSPTRISEFTATLPLISEQQAIAEVLGALDDKIAANDKVASTALELARVTYSYAIKEDSRTGMTEVLTPFLGGTPNRSDDSLWNGSTAWASAKDVTGAEYGVVLSTTESITDLAASKTRTRALPIGTVVLTARGTVGVVARLGLPAAINQSCYGFTSELIPASCLFFVIEGAAAQARSMAHGSVFDTITMATFEHVSVPMRDRCDWESLETQLAPILSSSEQAVSESRTLAATRDELLPLLMSGKVRVRDAEKIVEEVT